MTLELYEADRQHAGPVLVPLLELGRKVTMDEYSNTHDGRGGLGLPAREHR